MELDDRTHRIAVYAYGSLSKRELSDRLGATWTALVADPQTRGEIAAILDIPPQEVAAMPEPPLLLKAEHSNFDIGTATLAVAGWIASELLLAPVKDLAKEEAKRRLIALWAWLEPRFRSRLPTRNALGERTDGKRTDDPT